MRRPSVRRVRRAVVGRQPGDGRLDAAAGRVARADVQVRALRHIRDHLRERLHPRRHVRVRVLRRARSLHDDGGHVVEHDCRYFLCRHLGVVHLLAPDATAASRRRHLPGGVHLRAHGRTDVRRSGHQSPDAVADVSRVRLPLADAGDMRPLGARPAPTAAARRASRPDVRRRQVVGGAAEARTNDGRHGEHDCARRQLAADATVCPDVPVRRRRHVGASISAGRPGRCHVGIHRYVPEPALVQLSVVGTTTGFRRNLPKVDMQMLRGKTRWRIFGHERNNNVNYI